MGTVCTKQQRNDDPLSPLQAPRPPQEDHDEKTVDQKVSAFDPVSPTTPHRQQGKSRRRTATRAHVHPLVPPVAAQDAPTSDEYDPPTPCANSAADDGLIPIAPEQQWSVDDVQVGSQSKSTNPALVSQNLSALPPHPMGTPEGTPKSRSLHDAPESLKEALANLTQSSGFERYRAVRTWVGSSVLALPASPIADTPVVWDD